MKTNIKILFVCTWLFTMASCGRFGNNDKGDKNGVRIVCVSKQLNEMIFALGKGKDIVAVDLSSTFPDSVKLLPTVGYHRMLSAEGIISMNPTLVLHDYNIGPANVLPQLEKAGLNIKGYKGGSTIDSAELLLKSLGEYFKVPQKADSIVNKLNEDMALIPSKLKTFNIKDTPTVMVIQFGRATNAYFVMTGRGGIADKMIKYAGGKVATYDGKGARQLSAEALAIANPDIIIATDFGFDRMGSAEKFKELPGVALTNAAKNNRIYRYEEHDLVYFGPRTGQNIFKLMQLFYSPENVSEK
ncbi:MAG: ABC transporter substrate-binding protein [Bacteroidetes bacterium]|nr:ABC transporter substrate-binding protein [Bacteroidota bacterium]